MATTGSKTEQPVIKLISKSRDGRKAQLVVKQKGTSRTVHVQQQRIGKTNRFEWADKNGTVLTITPDADKA